MRKRVPETKYKGCFFCENKKETLDYKEEKQMRRHIDERGQIVDRRKSGLCSAHQRDMAVSLKRARHIAIIPFVMENLR
ncbi:MAG: 30S ribosomal protein S18 [Fibrobacterota bacterium]